MGFSALQIILVFVWVFIVAIDQFDFLESLYQPIVSGAVIGAILGDLPTGLIVGGTYQLMTIGNMPVGGAQPPNAVIGGVMATVFAISSHLDTTAAVGLAVPFALIGQYMVTFLFTLMSPMMSKADQLAAKGDTKGIVRLNYLAMALLGLLFAIVCTLGASLPSFLIILAIAMFFHQFEDNKVVAAMFAGIRPAVVALIAVPTFSLAKSAGISLVNCWIPILSALLIWLLGVNPIWVIIAAAVGGYIYGQFIQPTE